MKMMTAEIDTTQPQLRPDVVFGPKATSAGKTVYYMKDQRTQWFYRIGAKEQFVLNSMDGSRTLQQIGDEYAAHFGRSLDERAWQALFSILDKRQLLAETADTSRLEALQQEARQRRKQENRGLLRRRFPLLDPDAFLTKLLPWFRFAYHRAFVFPALLAIVAFEVFALLHGQALIGDVRASLTHNEGIIIVLFMALIWFIAACHETAHGLTCRRFGGSVQEIGIFWRYLSFFPYCKLDDVVLLHPRRHRVYVMFAGTFVSFLLLVPFAALWRFSPEQSVARELSAVVLTILNLGTFINLIPFVELDGYFMLSHALDMVDLRQQAHQFWLTRIKHALFKRGEVLSIGDDRRSRTVYQIYGICSLFFTLVFLSYTGYYWVHVLQLLSQGVIIWTIFPAMALILLKVILSTGKLGAKLKKAQHGKA
jgi:hypothetical protein